jgi:hypothetical protein
MPCIWGGTAELILFAAAFGIHVISVNKVENKVQFSTTINAFELLKVESTHSLPTFGKNPQSNLKDAIFLWNHDHGSLRKIRKMTNDPSNHYTLLELSDKKKEDLLPDQVFYLNHDDPLTPTKREVVKVLSTESKKAKRSLLPNADNLKDSHSKIQPPKPKAHRCIFIKDEDSSTDGQPLHKKPKIVVPANWLQKQSKVKEANKSPRKLQKDIKLDKVIKAPLEAKIPRKMKNGMNVSKPVKTAPVQNNLVAVKHPDAMPIEYNAKFPIPPAYVNVLSTELDNQTK